MVQGLLAEIIVIGDRVLIKPRKDVTKTAGGLYLPPNVQEREKVQHGYVIKVGPGYPLPAIIEDAESWAESRETVKYIPLQAKPGDLALFVSKNAYEVCYKGEQYLIVAHTSILMLERQEDFFD